MIQLVIFDIIGTTVIDKDATNYAMIETLAKFGYEVSYKEVEKVKSIARPLAIQMLLSWQGVPSTIISGTYIHKIYQHFLATLKSYYASSEHISPAENVEVLFQFLKKQGISIALNTHLSKEIALLIINRWQWLEKGWIDILLTNEEMVIGIDEDEQIFKVMELADIEDANKVAVVGDTPFDLEEGTRAGCKYVIGIASGSYSKEELTKAPHTHLISNLIELAAILFERQQVS